MFQYLLARVLQSHAPDAVIVGLDIPEFKILGLQPPQITNSTPHDQLVIRGHTFDFAGAIQLLKSSNDVEIQIAWPASRMEYFRNSLELAREIFPVDPALPVGFGADSFVIYVRLGDVLQGVHLNYPPLPISWYRHLVKRTGLKPVFVGEFGNDRYSQALRDAFPAASFISRDRLSDFNVLRTSCNLVLSVSAFAWMAAWLSDTARMIVQPVAGFFNPCDRPDVDLLPVDDSRYSFDLFPSEQWRATQEQIAEKIPGPVRSEPMSRDVRFTPDRGY